jgi:hypothetical protein
MQSIKYLPASSGVGNPSLMTVQTLRAANATTIITNTVAGVPAFFYATMGTPHTFTDPVTGETITIISEATAVDFAGHTNSGQLVIDAIAPGYTDAGSKVGDIIVLRPLTEWSNNLFNILNAGAHNDDGTLAKTALDTFYKPGDLTPYNFVVAGGAVIAGLGYGTTLTASMTAGACYINGLRNTIAAVPTRTYTASKDTYVDALYNVSGTATIVYTEVANGAASPTLAANSIRLAKVVTAATIVAAGSIVQAGLDTVTTSGQLNYIYNTSPSAAPVFTGVNAGGWGGQQYWRNQSGIKELWGNTTNQSVAASSSFNSGINFPANFFTVAQSGNFSAGNFSNSNMFAGCANGFPTVSGAVTVYLQNGAAGTQNAAVSYCIRGV